MAFDQFGYILVYNSIFDGKNDLSMGTPYTFDEGMSCHSTRIELFYFNENFRCIAQWVRPLKVVDVVVHSFARHDSASNACWSSTCALGWWGIIMVKGVYP